MNGAPDDVFRTTLSGLESGLLVRHIAAFDLKTCGADEEAAEVLENPALSDFDQVPVKENDQIIGVLERNGKTLSGSVRENMRHLDDSILVAAEMPLTKFVPLAKAGPYRLVLEGSEIKGIVTRSDIPKLPVRLFAFALVTHLEMVMANVICAKYPDEQAWLALLSSGRKKKLEEKLQLLKQANLNLSRLELTEFCDKRTIVMKLYNLGNNFEDELKEIEKLRNTLAHAGDYAQNEEDLNKFVECLHQAEHWIEQLTRS